MTEPLADPRTMSEIERDDRARAFRKLLAWAEFGYKAREDNQSIELMRYRLARIWNGEGDVEK